MNTYLDQIGRQEFTRQHFERISTTIALPGAASRPGNLTQHIQKRNKFTEQSEPRLVFPRFNRSLASLIQSLRG
jgi:hypothetical protein